MSPSTRQIEFSPEECRGKQKRQELFCNLKVQRDKATKSKLWNLIKSWMENKIYKWHFGVHWGHLTVDCVSIHIGDHKGLLFISLDVVMIFWVQWRRSLLLKRHQLEYCEWSIVMFSAHFECFRKNKGERKPMGNPGWECIYVYCTVFNFCTDLKRFQVKVRENKSSAKSLFTKNVVSCFHPLPVSQDICFQCI